MKPFLLLLVLLSASFPVFSQANRPLDAGEIVEALQKLNTTGSVLYIAAHPDDENTRLLSYLANEKKLRTGYLSLTRGDGGQNRIGKEQGEALGLIRTQELLAARRTDGAEQFFTRANDFGFSKNPEETFSIWNRDSILSDVVLTIRRFKPDVIVCRFPTTGEGGHGHHTASAILALEAFDAAADPTRFPEQLAYTEVWQAKRIFWNTFNFGSVNTTSPNQLKTDVGLYNPLLGKGYGEIAAESRSCHKSQGFGTAKTRGSAIEYFKLLKGDSARADILEGINTSWSRLKGQEKIQQAIEACMAAYQPQHPERSVAALASIYQQIFSMPASDPLARYWKTQKLKEAEALLLSCSGLWLEAAAADYCGIPGRNISISTQLVNRSSVNVTLKHISYSTGHDSAMSLPLKMNELYTFKHQETLPASMGFSNPYWLNTKHETGMYHIADPSLIGKSQNDAALRVSFSLLLEGVDLRIERDLVYKFTDPVGGEIYRPFEVLPPVTVNIPEKVFVFADASPRSISLTVKANMAKAKGKVVIESTPGWNISLKHPEFELASKGDEAVVEVIVNALPGAKNGTLKASVEVEGKTYTKSIRRIEYDHIPYQFILSDAEAGLVNVNLKRTGKSIGYIPGAGDDVPAALKQIGYDVTMLSEELLNNENLSKYQAIVTGVRAYNTNDRLPVHYAKLMDYVKHGGNLVVQYNTNNRLEPVQAKIGPYPFTVSTNRVTNEKAPVIFNKPKHSALNFPNPITQEDFEGWIQERGIYFATEIDPQYETILGMNDPQEKTQDGSLLIGKYGKGNFVYTGLVFFRELPAGVPGAYRLFVNLLSLPANK